MASAKLKLKLTLTLTWSSTATATVSSAELGKHSDDASKQLEKTQLGSKFGLELERVAVAVAVDDEVNVNDNDNAHQQPPRVEADDSLMFDHFKAIPTELQTAPDGSPRYLRSTQRSRTSCNSVAFTRR